MKISKLPILITLMLTACSSNSSPINDHSSGSLRSAYRTLKSNGTKTDLYWDDEDTHFILVNQTDEIIDFINRNLK